MFIKRSIVAITGVMMATSLAPISRAQMSEHVWRNLGFAPIVDSPEPGDGREHVTITERMIANRSNSPGQTTAPLRDASDQEFASSKAAPRSHQYVSGAAGTDSVAMLQNPLRGDAKKWLVEAEKLLKKGQRDKALPLLEKAAADRSALPYAYTILGAEHLRMGLTDVALRELESAVALLPGFAPNHYNLAVALAKVGRVDEALAEAQRALQLDPGRAEYRYALGIFFMRVGRKEEAKFHLTKAAAEIPAASALLSQYFAQ